MACGIRSLKRAYKPRRPLAHGRRLAVVQMTSSLPTVFTRPADPGNLSADQGLSRCFRVGAKRKTITMTLTFPGFALAVTLTSDLTAPAAADPGHQGYPLDLATKSPGCVLPRHTWRDDIRFGRALGDRLSIDDHILGRDLDRLGVERLATWRCYRSDDPLYRVDAETCP